MRCSTWVTRARLLPEMASPFLRAPEALLFDLGGVLIDIDFGRAIAA